MLPKTWVAIHRRTDTGPPLHQCFDLILQAISNETACETIPGLVIPETVVLLQQSTHWYHYSEDAKCVLRKPPNAITTDAIYRAMVYLQQCDPKKHGDIVAVFWSEKTDALGTLVCLEYLDDVGLRALLETKPNRCKLGVLMQFVAPSYQQYLYQFVINSVPASDGKVQCIERHISRARFDLKQKHTMCQRACCLHPIPVVGKLTTATAPHQPQDLQSAVDDITNPAFQTHFTHVLSCLTTQLTTAFGCPYGRLDKLCILTQLDPNSHALMLIGVVALGVQGSRKEVEFELLQPRMATASSEKRNDQAVDPTMLDDLIPRMDLSRPPEQSEDLLDTMGVPPVSPERGRPQTARSAASSGYSPRRPLMPPLSDQMEWSCPNCGASSNGRAESIARVPIRIEHVVAFHDRTIHQRVVDLRHALRVHDGTYTLQLESIDDEPAPLLSKLNVPVHEVRNRKVWCDNKVVVCEECARTFCPDIDIAATKLSTPPALGGFKTPRPPSASTRGSASGNRTAAPSTQPQRPATARATIDAPSPFLREDLSLKNRMVFTTYQSLHREFEEHTRLMEEYSSMKDSYARARVAAAAPVHARMPDGNVVDIADPDNVLEDILVDPALPENPLDVPYSIVLMNELHQFTCALVGPDAAESVPVPPVTIALGKSLEDISLRKQRMEGSGVDKCRTEVLRTLEKGSRIVKELKQDEISLLLEVANE